MRTVITLIYVVYDLAYRGMGIRRNQYQIQISLTCFHLCIFSRHDTYLLSVLADKTDFLCTDFFIYQ